MFAHNLHGARGFGAIAQRFFMTYYVECFRRIVPRPALLLLIMGFVGCGHSDGDWLADVAPNIPARSIEALVDGSDDDLRAYYAESGHARIRLDFHSLTVALWNASPEQREDLIGLMGRLGVVWAEEYNTSYGSWLTEYYATKDPNTRDQVISALSEFATIYESPDRYNEERLSRLEELLGIFRETGFVPGEVVTLSRLAQFKAFRDHRQESYDMFTEALSLSESIGYTGMTCQNLGALATLARQLGHPEVGKKHLDRMAAIAEETRLAIHAGRAETFRGHVALAEGKLNAAYLHFMKARERCVRFEGAGSEILFIRNLVTFFSRLQCWNIVADYVRQAEVLELNAAKPDEWMYENYLKSAMAEVRAGQGDLSGALELAEEVARETGPQPLPQDHAVAGIKFAELLLAAGRVDEAREIIETGIGHADSNQLTGESRAFRLLEIAALEESGRTATALDKLGEVASDIEAADAVVMHDARDEALLGMRLTLKEFGDGPEAAAAFVRAMRILQRRMTAGPPSAHMYLDLQGFDELRWLVHEMIADDPRLGYEFDMAWRGLTEVARLDVGFPAEARFPDVQSAVEALVDLRFGGERDRLREGGDWQHLVYVVTDTDIWRWRRAGDEVVRELLDWSPGRMRDTAALALEKLATPPDAEAGGVERELQEPLEELGRQLIPADLADQDGEVWISADDALTQLPFATFDREGGDGYDPLIANLDVGYLRFFRAKEHSRVGKANGALVVGDPAIAEEWRRRRDGLEPLPDSREEARQAAAILDTDKLYVGGQATKANILANWSDAGVIYFAGHVVRGENVPYLTMIPLAEEILTTRAEDEILEAADILQAEYSNCELVVLSGCSSGAPYVEGSISSPGMGDSFLDAGAACVVQTLWQVEDDAVAPIMLAYLGAQGETIRFPESPVLENKKYLTGTGDPVHPYYWGGDLLTSDGVR